MVVTVTSSQPSSAHIGAQLHSGRISGMREQMGRYGRGALLGLSMMSAPSFQRDDAEPTRRDPVMQMHEDRHTMNQYANPGGSMPNLQAASNEIRNAGTGQESGADDIDQQMAEAADANQQAQSMGMAARAKSQAKGATENAAMQMMDKVKKEFEELMAQAKSQLISKGLSLVDWGNKAAILDTIGTSLSGIQTTLSIFQDSMSEQQKSMLTKMGLPMIKISKGVGAPAAAATVTQYSKWATIVFFLAPFLIIFIFYTVASIANAVNGDIKGAFGVIRTLL